MLAMQYSIQLPSNYDGARIKERVNKRKKLFDKHNGLVHKSFLYSSEENIYAPFYVWKDAVEARKFLIDDLFHGVIEDFSRQRVRSWFVLDLEYGNRSLKPKFARREVDIIPDEVKLELHLRKDKEVMSGSLSDPNLYMYLIALDADRWEILHYSLWKDKASAAKPNNDSHLNYEVLHVSEPETV